MSYKISEIKPKDLAVIIRFTVTQITKS